MVLRWSVIFNLNLIFSEVASMWHFHRVSAALGCWCYRLFFQVFHDDKPSFLSLNDILELKNMVDVVTKWSSWEHFGGDLSAVNFLCGNCNVASTGVQVNKDTLPWDMSILSVFEMEACWQNTCLIMLETTTSCSFGCRLSKHGIQVCILHIKTADLRRILHNGCMWTR